MPVEGQFHQISENKKKIKHTARKLQYFCLLYQLFNVTIQKYTYLLTKGE
jgi:hypothetical protein